MFGIDSGEILIIAVVTEANRPMMLMLCVLALAAAGLRWRTRAEREPH